MQRVWENGNIHKFHYMTERIFHKKGRHLYEIHVKVLHEKMPWISSMNVIADNQKEINRMRGGPLPWRSPSPLSQEGRVHAILDNLQLRRRHEKEC